MKYISIINDTIRIPLAVLTSFSYSKRGNIVETSRNTHISRGFGCQELSISFSLTPSVLVIFNEVGNTFSSFGEMAYNFMSLEPDIETEPSHVYLAGNVICPELLFSLTSITATPQSDLYGVLQRVDVQMVLSGSKCSKESAKQMPVSYDENAVLPRVSVTCKGKTAVCQDSISICELVITPTTLNISLLLSTSHADKSSNAWVYTVATDKTVYIDVDGYGRYYVQNAHTDGDSVSYECSIFSRNADAVITKTLLDSTLQSVLNALDLSVSVKSDSISKINVDNYTIHSDSVQTLKELASNLGFLAAFRENTAFLFELPETLNNADELNYFIEDDIVSSPTTKAIYRDGLHEFSSGSDAGFCIIVNSPVCTKTDRASKLLDVQRFMERGITIEIPLNTHIKHYSGVRLNYNGNQIDCLVTDFSADLLANTMILRLNYLER